MLQTSYAIDKSKMLPKMKFLVEILYSLFCIRLDVDSKPSYN